MNNSNPSLTWVAWLCAAALLLPCVGITLAGVHYVDVNSTNATPPFTNWTTAATTIQGAVDAALAGDEIVVTNGSYAPVVVVKPLSVRSMNGLQFTIIDGGNSNQCVRLVDGAALSGFTLTNGMAQNGGGVYGGAVTNCVLTGNAAWVGGGAYQCILNNCRLSGNSSWGNSGAGASYCTLSDCTLTRNSGNGASYSTLNHCTLAGNSTTAIGGGASYSTLNNCTLIGNSAWSGGGAYECTLTKCALTSNSARDGGGTFGGMLNACTLSGNSATDIGGGAHGGTLNNCALRRNLGGGAYSSTLNNCTLTGNAGGGARYCTLTNCIVYFNTSQGGANYDSYSSLNYCCTTPQPINGVGNISLDPQLASLSHLSAGSPCRGAGNAASARGTDIDGEAWLSPPSIGSDEYHAGAVTGALSVAISTPNTSVTVGFAASVAALIEGRTAQSVWNFGDGFTATNQPYTSHTWTVPADYRVVLRAYNESQPGGISATVTVHVVAQPVHYVALESTNPVAPFTSWATAATNIQVAVDAATVAGALVLVTNGTYATGGRATGADDNTLNRVALDKPLVLRSVNGPRLTVIDGNLGRCAYLSSGASLSGFTLTNGASVQGSGAHGGVLSDCILSGNFNTGAHSCMLSNCTLTGNSYGAENSTLNDCTLNDNSSAAINCTLKNCTLTGNGVGAIQCVLNNCTLTGNSGQGYGGGGGAFSSTLNNCIVYFNREGNYDSSCTLNYCCTTPQPTNGVGNISSDPQLASASHLSAGSPCRGAGHAAYASSTDIDGEAWLSPPSIGCDEYHAGAVIGPLILAITASFTNVTVGFTVQLTALVEGQTSASSWDFGDGTTATNAPYTSHAWATPGDYPVVLRAFNESQPGGMSATLIVHVVAQPVHYVAAGNAHPVTPFTSWATAARNIQDAVDAATVPGALVLVSDGAYAAGAHEGSAVVTVDKFLTLRSVNGPLTTIISGGGSNRCAFVSSGATLSGFTLTNGFGPFSNSGAGVSGNSLAAVVSNCVVSGNSCPSGAGGGAASCTLNNCTLTANSAPVGAAAYSCTLNNCTLTRNGAYLGVGGGAASCTLNNCTVSGNSAYNNGGGVAECTLNNCAVNDNYSRQSGGAYNCTLNHCTLTGNSYFGAYGCTLNDSTLTGNSGGGAYKSTLNHCTVTGTLVGFFGGEGAGASLSTLNNCTLADNQKGGAIDCHLTNCTLTGNSGVGAMSSTLNNCTVTGSSSSGAYVCMLTNCALTGNSGVGAMSSTLNNCTLTGNSAGGARYCTLNNCIVYFNTGENYDLYSTLNYSCATPPPPTGVGNISSDPQLASSTRLSAGSPCRGAGNAVYANGTDIDGEAWLNPPSIGCDEFHAGALTGPLTVAISASFTNVTTGFPAHFGGWIEGRAAASSWDFGDGVTATNQPFTYHAWTTLGDYTVILRAANESQPGGISATLTVHVVPPPIHYVAVDSASPQAPYTSWATAAATIQDAVDAATVPGALVLVTNGTYAAGGRVVLGETTMLVADKFLTVQSVNGPLFTAIDGLHSFRCVYLTNNASLSGFTLTNGSAQYGGGVYGGRLNNCLVISNSASYSGGGAYACTLSNCTLSGNVAAFVGGGAYSCTLNNCTLTGNTHDGASGCTLSNCTLAGNFGVGATSSSLNNCRLADNRSSAVSGCMLTNCVLTGNSGAGAISSTLNNCTLTGNSGGGAHSCTVNNCIVYFNTGENYDLSSILNYSCATPRPPTGVGNISSDPQLASSSHLSVGSPCRGAGNAAYATGTDVDGEPWLNPPSIGCDEYHAGALTGSLTVAISASFTNVTMGFPVQLTGSIEGRAAASSWDFGDTVMATNRPFISHAWTSLGDYTVVLRAYNESQPGGISAILTVHVVPQPIHYVAVDGVNPVAPYTSWATAATNIQAAVDAATVPGALVLVTNGTYAAGGVAVNKPLALRSVNGPLFTTIDGARSQWCVSLTNNASLSGFTLTNGIGGAAGGTLNNCIVTGNGAGAYSATLNNCALSGNAGVGASGCTANNCTLTGNSGGGAVGSTLYNCILFFNGGANYDSSCTLNYCCATPPPAFGVGNLSSDPQLASSFHLSSSSPCRGAGNAVYATGIDVDGERWLNPPSIGCDEYHDGAVTGPLSAAIIASFTNVAAGFAVQLRAMIDGRTVASFWDFGDGSTAANQPFASHAWASPGDYVVVLRAENESQPAGISTTVTVHVVRAFYYVAADSTHPVPPYRSWATAAINIQDAIDAAAPGAQVLVTRGSYFPVSVFASISVRSVHGPQNTVIDGGRQSPCAYLEDGATLSGFTLTHGFSSSVGGGVFCASRSAVISNCLLVGNHAWDNNSGYAAGGGAYGGTLNNCTLSDNSAFSDGWPFNNYGSAYGGGAYNCTLNNCTLTRNAVFPARGNNYSSAGGGVYGCALNNCIVYLNSAPYGDQPASSSLNHCWTYDPGFVDLAGGNFRLRANSPCINAGLNALAPAGPDLDDNPRIARGTVDIGAYEFQSPASMISYAWLQQNGFLPANGSTDTADPDGDGLNNRQEWQAGTDPSNDESVLAMDSPARTASGMVVTWQSVAGKTYFLDRATDLAAPLPFSTVASKITGHPFTTSYTDTNAIGAGPWFYRVGVGD